MSVCGFLEGSMVYAAFWCDLIFNISTPEIIISILYKQGIDPLSNF